MIEVVVGPEAARGKAAATMLYSQEATASLPISTVDTCREVWCLAADFALDGLRTSHTDNLVSQLTAAGVGKDLRGFSGGFERSRSNRRWY